jgi:hypothetical protein
VESADEEGVESLASIDSITYNADFFDPTEEPITSQNDYVSLMQLISFGSIDLRVKYSTNQCFVVFLVRGTI